METWPTIVLSTILFLEYYMILTKIFNLNQYHWTSICMNQFIYTYICMYTYTYRHIYMYTNTYRHIYMYVDISKPYRLYSTNIIYSKAHEHTYTHTYIGSISSLFYVYIPSIPNGTKQNHKP